MILINLQLVEYNWFVNLLFLLSYVRVDYVLRTCFFTRHLISRAFYTPFSIVKYRQSSGYDSLDLRCFEVTNAPRKNIKDNDIQAVKLDHCDQELQYFHTAIFGSLAFVICILNDVNNCELLRLRTSNHYVSVAWYSIYDVPTYTEIRVTSRLKNGSML